MVKKWSKHKQIYFDNCFINFKNRRRNFSANFWNNQEVLLCSFCFNVYLYVWYTIGELKPNQKSNILQKYIFLSNKILNLTSSGQFFFQGHGLAFQTTRKETFRTNNNCLMTYWKKCDLSDEKMCYKVSVTQGSLSKKRLCAEKVHILKFQ